MPLFGYQVYGFGTKAVTSVASSELFLATFTAADGTGIDVYVPDVPADGYVTSTAGAYDINGNVLTLDTSSSGDDFVIYDLGRTPTEYTLTCDLTMFGSGVSAGPGIFAGSINSGSLDDCYLLRFDGSSVLLQRRTAGTPTTLDSASFSRTNLTNYNLLLEITATEIRGYVDDTVLVRATDTTHRGQYFGFYTFASDTGSTPGQDLADNLQLTVGKRSRDRGIVSNFTPLSFVTYLSDVEGQLDKDIISTLETLTLVSYDTTIEILKNVVSDFDQKTLTAFDSDVEGFVNIDIVSNFDTILFTEYKSSVIVEGFEPVNIVSNRETLSFVDFNSNVSLLPPPPPPGDFPGGFIETPSNWQARGPLDTPASVSFLPSSVGEFTFPAPWNTRGIRLTNTGDISYVGYSYWPISNNHVNDDTIKLFVGRPSSQGGPSIVEYNKITGAVSQPTPIFPPGSLRSISTELWYWSQTDPNAIYYPAENDFYKINVSAGTRTSIFNGNRIGPNYKLWQAHSDRSGTKHAMTYRTGNYQDLGAVVYNETNDTFQTYPLIGSGFDEAAIDKSGRYLIMLEQVDGQQGADNRIIDLQTGQERLVTDPQGAAGHADRGFGYQVNQHNYSNRPNAAVLINFNTNPIQITEQYYNNFWFETAADHISHCNALPNIPPEDQYVLASSANDGTAVHANEVIAFRLDGSLRTLVCAPVMTNYISGADGGGGNYGRSPKGNVDITGQYFFWTSNMGGSNNMDLFAVKIPSQLLYP